MIGEPSLKHYRHQLYASVKRDLLVSKETYYSVKRDLLCPSLKHYRDQLYANPNLNPARNP
jgi:hypothetical protein